MITFNKKTVKFGIVPSEPTKSNKGFLDYNANVYECLIDKFPTGCYIEVTDKKRAKNCKIIWNALSVFCEHIKKNSFTLPEAKEYMVNRIINVNNNRIICNLMINLTNHKSRLILLHRDSKAEIDSIVNTIKDLNISDDDKTKINFAILEESKIILNSYSKIQNFLKAKELIKYH